MTHKEHLIRMAAKNLQENSRHASRDANWASSSEEEARKYRSREVSAVAACESAIHILEQAGADPGQLAMAREAVGNRHEFKADSLIQALSALPPLVHNPEPPEVEATPRDGIDLGEEPEPAPEPSRPPAVEVAFTLADPETLKLLESIDKKLDFFVPEAPVPTIARSLSQIADLLAIIALRERP